MTRKDSRAEQDQLSGLLSPWLKRLRFRASLDWLTGDRVLDYGCGVAEYSEWIPDAMEYVGLEHNPKIVAMAHARYPDLSILQGNVMSDEDLYRSLREDPFDAIVMLAVIEHVSEPLHLLARLYEVLRPNGRIIMTTPSPIGEFVINITGYLGLSSKESHDEHEQLLGKSDLVRLLTTSGYRVEHYHRFLLGLNQVVIGRKPLDSR